MPRLPRVDVADEIYHVINRANARHTIFLEQEDYLLFEQLLEEAKELVDIRIYAYCIMPNHWHLLLSPKENGKLSEYMKWLTNTHTRRWHTGHNTIGTGPLYQGRYKSFLVQKETYAQQVHRYIEQNPLRAKLTKKAEDWRWSSLWRRQKGTPKQQKLLTETPYELGVDYLGWVNQIDNADKLEDIRTSVNKMKPFGDFEWTMNKIEQHGLQASVREVGRPKN